MEWQQIMKMEDPHKALRAIHQKVLVENLSVMEMMDRMDEYAEKHKISTDEMAFYPNGDQVICPPFNWPELY